MAVSNISNTTTPFNAANNRNTSGTPENVGSGEGTNAGAGSNATTGSTGSGSGAGTNTGNNTNSSGGTNTGNNTGTGSGSGVIGKPGNTEATTQKDPNTLDRDAFLRLFLEQLKAQDPTAPMETNQILEQTALMTQVEQQQEMKKTLTEMTESIKSMSESSTKLAELQTKMSEVLTSLSQNIGDNTTISNLIAQLSAYNSSGVVGKIAETTFTAIGIAKEDVGKEQTFDIWFDEAINLDPEKGGNPNAKVVIKDKNGGVIREINLKDYKDENGESVDLNGKKGYVTFKWDGKDKSSINVPAGAYTITAEYNFESDKKTAKTTRIGRGEVTGLAFQDGVPFVKLGNSTSPLNYYQLLGATQFYAKA